MPFGIASSSGLPFGVLIPFLPPKRSPKSWVTAPPTLKSPLPMSNTPLTALKATNAAARPAIAVEILPIAFGSISETKSPTAFVILENVSTTSPAIFPIALKSMFSATCFKASHTDSSASTKLSIAPVDLNPSTKSEIFSLAFEAKLAILSTIASKSRVSAKALSLSASPSKLMRSSAPVKASTALIPVSLKTENAGSSLLARLSRIPSIA